MRSAIYVSLSRQENGDGELDLEEFRHACKAEAGDERVKKLFDLLDERRLTPVEVRQFAVLLFGPEAEGLPQPQLDWPLAVPAP